MKYTFSTSTMTHISKILLKPNTIVLELVMFFENRKRYAKKAFRVLSCVIHTIIRNYVCIDYLGNEKKIRWFTTCFCWELQIYWQKYDNVLGFGIPDMLMNLLSCQDFLKNNDFVVILKFPNRMFEYYFNKGFIIFDCDENSLRRLPSEVE